MQRRHWVATAIVVLAVLIVLLFFLGPLGTLVERGFATPALAAAIAWGGAHKAAVAGVAGALLAVLLTVCLLRRRWRVLAGLVISAALLALVYGTHVFRSAYPRADAFDRTRLADAGAMLLGTDVPLGRFDPEPRLRAPRATVMRAAFPAIDIHFHLGSLPPSITPRRLVQAMDAAGIAKLINLDGSADNFRHFAATFRREYPDRFVLFVKPDMTAIRRPGGIEAEVRRMIDAARDGARGVKVAKSLGLTVRDASGALVALDDSRLDPIWDTAARLGLPVLMHSGDPPAFFDTIDEHNERFEELVQNPDWSRAGPGNPTFAALMQQRERLLARHPGTTFIGAHVGSNEEDLAYAGSLLDRYPNYNVDLSSRVAGLGRQPYTARRFFLRYADRILYGSDGGFGLDPERGWTPERFFRSYIEFLETENEYLQYPLWGALNQGRWRVHGLGLPRDVLEKIYVRNAERLLPSDESVRANLAALR